MACEAKRGCGYRKAGGIYLVGDLSGCVPVDYLPTCIDYPFTRSATWAEPARLLQGVPAGEATGLRLQERLLLMWVGSAHYTPESFMEEAKRMGVSKRIAAIPEDAKKGDVVALAHPGAMVAFEQDGVLRSPHVRSWDRPTLSQPSWLPCEICREVPTATALANMMRGAGSDLAFVQRQNDRMAKELGEIEARKREKLSEPARFRQLGATDPRQVAAVFCCFELKAVELVLPASFARDAEIMRKCEERGVKIVEVPDGDGDHVHAGWKLPSWLSEEKEPALPGILEAPETPDSDEQEEAVRP